MEMALQDPKYDLWKGKIESCTSKILPLELKTRVLTVKHVFLAHKPHIWWILCVYVLLLRHEIDAKSSLEEIREQVSLL